MAASRDASEMMVSMAALILHDEGLPIEAGNISKLIDAAGGKIEAYWPKLFCSALEGVDINSMMSAIGSASAAPTAGPASTSAPAVEEKVEEKKEEEEEEEEDMGFGLFD